MAEHIALEQEAQKDARMAAVEEAKVGTEARRTVPVWMITRDVVEETKSRLTR